MLVKKVTKQMIEKVLVSASMALIAAGLAAPASAASNHHSVSAGVTPAPPAPAAVAGPLDAASGGTGVHVASLTGCVSGLDC
jgi:hypothetical protein